MVSEATIAELDEVLCRPKFNKYVPEKMRLKFFEALVRTAEIVPVNQTVAACRDPKDNKFLELAISCNASHIISGDADLLVLHPFHEVAIVSPQVFLTSL